MFDIPVVVFLFRRIDTLDKIFSRIRAVKPAKIYLIADQGRNQKEIKQAILVRKKAESLIDWDCEVIKNYATKNRGVYENIGLGAKWTFQREKSAIFLEDDNLPEVSFFYYCKELLRKYAENPRVLWICGTNYLTEYKNKNSDSYMFTHNLLPCGWASWSNKFLKYYDFDLRSIHNINDIKKIHNTYIHKALYRQEFNCIYEEYIRREKGEKFLSWDYHMIYSIRANNLLGIAPSENLIKNIGVDSFSAHGGNSFSDVMTRRFCGMDSKPLAFPLKDPSKIEIDKKFEREIENIITVPFYIRLKNKISKIIRSLFNIPEGTRTLDFFKKNV